MASCMQYLPSVVFTCQTERHLRLVQSVANVNAETFERPFRRLQDSHDRKFTAKQCKVSTPSTPLKDGCGDDCSNTSRGKPKALSIAGCQLSAAVPTELSTVSCPFPAILSAPMLLGAITVPGTVLGSEQCGLILAVGSGKQTKLQQHLRLQQSLPGYVRHTRYQHQTSTKLRGAPKSLL